MHWLIYQMVDPDKKSTHSIYYIILCVFMLYHQLSILFFQLHTATNQYSKNVTNDFFYQSNKVAKIRNRYNQVPHLTQDTNLAIFSEYAHKFSKYLCILQIKSVMQHFTMPHFSEFRVFWKSCFTFFQYNMRYLVVSVKNNPFRPSRSPIVITQQAS